MKHLVLIAFLILSVSGVKAQKIDTLDLMRQYIEYSVKEDSSVVFCFVKEKGQLSDKVLHALFLAYPDYVRIIDPHIGDIPQYGITSLVCHYAYAITIKQEKGKLVMLANPCQAKYQKGELSCSFVGCRTYQTVYFEEKDNKWCLVVVLLGAG